MRRWALGLAVGLAGCGAGKGDTVVATAEAVGPAAVKSGPYTVRFDQGPGKALFKTDGSICYVNTHLDFSVDPVPPKNEQWELRIPNPTQPPESDWPDMSFSLRPDAAGPNSLDFTIPVPDGWRGESYELNGDLVQVEERRFKALLPEVRCLPNQYEGPRSLRLFTSSGERTLRLSDGVTVRVRKQAEPATSLPVEISWDAGQVMPHLPEEKAVLGGLWSNMGFVDGHTGELETDRKRIWDLRVSLREDQPIDPKTVEVQFTLRKPARRYPVDLTFGFKWK